MGTGGGGNFFPFRVDPFRIYVGSQNIYMVVSAPFCGFLSCSPRKRVYSRGGFLGWGQGGRGGNFFPFRVDPFRIYVGSQNIYMVVSAPFCGFLSCSPRKRVFSRGGVLLGGGGGGAGGRAISFLLE